MSNLIAEFGYTPKIVRGIIKHYYGYQPSSYVFEEFDNISCLFADIDNAINCSLSPREREIVIAVKLHGDNDISSVLGISCGTVKIHLINASTKISNYLNGVRK